MQRRAFLKMLSVAWLPVAIEGPPRHPPYEPVNLVPRFQVGTVSGVLSPDGLTILPISYNFIGLGVPHLIASPAGQGDLSVESFEANALTDQDGSVAVKGQPNAPVTFTWLAYKE